MSKDHEPGNKSFYIITGYFCPKMMITYCDQTTPAPKFPHNIVVVTTGNDEMNEFFNAREAAKRKPGHPHCNLHNIPMDPILVKLEKSANTPPAPPARI
jgi:hypothetical protein